MHIVSLCRYSISGHPSDVTAFTCTVSGWCHLVVQEENAWVSTYSITISVCTKELRDTPGLEPKLFCVLIRLFFLSSSSFCCRAGVFDFFSSRALVLVIDLI